MKRKTAVTDETWEKLHAAFVAPPAQYQDHPTLEQLARRHRVPLVEAQTRASREEWNTERQAVEARDYFDRTAPGIKTEVAFCLHHAASMTKVLGRDLGAIGGAELLADQIADARVIWRRRMGYVLLWEALLASRRFGPRASVPHGREEGVA